MKLKNKTIWITWEHHQRNRSVSKNLGIPLFVYESRLPNIVRYGLSMVWVVKVIMKERPRCVIVQNPSIVLAIVASILKPVFNYILFIDAHNAGINPVEGKYRILNLISRYLQRSANLCIVTNKILANIVLKNGGNPYILPDPLPEPPGCSPIILDGTFIVFVICSFRDDEPFKEIIEAAEMLQEQYQFYFSGNYKRGNIIPQNHPRVKFLGYVDDEKYWSILNTCSVVVDLTKRDDCLVCGAYESISVLKPVILTDSVVNRELFKTGCVYTKLSANEIAASIHFSEKNYIQLTADVNILKKSLKSDWEKYKKDLLSKIDQEIGNCPK